ncbi:hypothetical protein [Chitinophaga sp. sic0106]|uniref:hypothetical protein n=1 Tax=Chitinophaga sp. sic0106 TaxID=2854785 RepID=UPI001C45F71C|nr:hypothetical protein [Chitinophaga sp. sic0106]MBV7532343.1 hypothetical protein [Chitinophaga sp. sic0106]
MFIVDVATKNKKKVLIRPVERKDFSILTKKRFLFDWKAIQSETSIYILFDPDDQIILGAMAVLKLDAEERIEIKLLTCSRENIGRGKNYDRIAGCLIAFACQLAVEKFGYHACVSLVPKTELAVHYIEKYGMKNAGWQLYLDGERLGELINEYLL